MTEREKGNGVQMVDLRKKSSGQQYHRFGILRVFEHLYTTLS
jgi:hypothetical protein